MPGRELAFLEATCRRVTTKPMMQYYVYFKKRDRERERGREREREKERNNRKGERKIDC